MDVEAGYPKVFVMVMEKSILFLGFAALFLKSFLQVKKCGQLQRQLEKHLGQSIQEWT